MDTWGKHRRAMEAVTDDYVEAAAHGDYGRLNAARIRQTAVMDQVNAHLRRTRRATRRFMVGVMVMNAALGVWGLITEHWLSVALAAFSIPLLFSVRRRLPPL